MNERVVLCLSGGMDSSTLLYDLLERGRQVSVIGFDYGQRHRKELDAAKAITNAVGSSIEIFNLSDLARLFGGSSLTDSSLSVPEGHYSDDSMKATVVPNRNLVFLSIAAAYASSRRIQSICFAAHSGDHTIYPDCKQEFVEALRTVLQLSDWQKVRLEAPFINLSKKDICKRGFELGVPFQLTWSCYKGKEFHCGYCGTCTERREAFQESGVVDPTLYECPVTRVQHDEI